MVSNIQQRSDNNWPMLTDFPLPAKVLVTMITLTMTVAMLGAAAQVTVHDVIPTMTEMVISKEDASGARPQTGNLTSTAEATGGRGDLFGEQMEVEAPSGKSAFYKSEQFIWALKWTHIHLFGINMIFIFMGGITLFLDLSAKSRSWLIGLPFLGVIIDIAAMWLKAFVSPAFFWLHLPGGLLFGVIFLYVTLRALWEMWGMSTGRNSR